MPLHSLLVINPNSSQSVTEGLRDVLRSPPGTTLAFYTAPADAPPSIDDNATSTLSSAACMRDILEKGLLDQHDGFLVSCFSDHPLTYALQKATDKPVLGIFQASVAQALLCGGKFGILTTGLFEQPYYLRYAKDETATGPGFDYAGGVDAFLGSRSDKFCGVILTNLGVLELRDGGDRVESKMKEGSAELAALGADVVILGCAGMAGKESLVHAGYAGFKDVRVVDGNKAGVELVAALVRLGVCA